MTQTPTDALIEKGQNRALCDAAQAIIERNYKPRPGTATAIAPNGQPYASLKTRFYTTAGEAVGELQGQLRNLNVASQGDTVWWRTKPEVEFEIQNRKWQARSRLALGWARDEKPNFTPGNEHPDGAGVIMEAAYPEDGAGAAPEPGMGGQLPTWKCHKVVQADRIVGVIFAGAGVMINRGPATAGPGMPTAVKLECGVEVEIDPIKLFSRGAPEVGQDYLVRYEDGYLSWSPRKAFEDGYTRQTL